MPLIFFFFCLKIIKIITIFENTAFCRSMTKPLFKAMLGISFEKRKKHFLVFEDLLYIDKRQFVGQVSLQWSETLYYCQT